MANHTNNLSGNVSTHRMGREPRAASSPMLNRGSTKGLRLGRIASVDVHLDWSLLIIVALITANLGAGLFPSWHPEWSMPLSWTVAVAAALLFIASILLHEVSHAVVGRSQGISVSRIDLFLFGGLAHMENEPPSPKAEFWMAIVGPLVSIAIGVLATVAGTLFANFDLRNFNLDDPVAAMQSIGPAATLLLWLGPINIVLGLFNMVPGFPLDGGRVLRSLLWATTKDRLKATRWASAAGQAFAWILMGIGVLNIFGGALASGIWLLLIGWFLNNAARMSYEQLLVRTALHDVPVSRVMRTQIVTVPPDTKIETLVQKHFMATDQHAFPVEYDHDLVGLVCMNDIRKVPHERWPFTSVSEIMTPTAQLSSLSQNQSAEQALEELALRDVDQIPILDGPHILGLVRRSDIVKWIALQGAPQLGRAV